MCLVTDDVRWRLSLACSLRKWPAAGFSSTSASLGIGASSFLWRMATTRLGLWLVSAWLNSSAGAFTHRVDSSIVSFSLSGDLFSFLQDPYTCGPWLCWSNFPNRIDTSLNCSQLFLRAHVVELFLKFFHFSFWQNDVDLLLALTVEWAGTDGHMLLTL